MPRSSQPFLFKYSGNKKDIVPLLRPRPAFKRAVEPYLGSGAFICSCDAPALGIDINPNIIDLWTWLRDEATPERLSELGNIAKEAVDKAPDKKPDVRTLGLSKGETLYLRINITSVCVGQLSSWKIYPQHKLPIAATTAILDRLKSVELVLGNEDSYVEKDGDFVLLDPPYLATTANYKQDGRGGIEEGYDPQATVRLIRRLSCPIILTYGTNAKEIFPEFDWEVVKIKKVPNLRRGGTIERIEHATYINWR
jgi:site-specific DNA-adenine methylase